MNRDIQDLFYVGLYSRVTQEVGSIPKDDEELEFLVLRSRLALNQIDFVLNATRQQANAAQKGCSLLAQALKTPSPDDVERILGGRDEMLVRTSPIYAIALSLINLRAERYSDALEILNGIVHPEAAALRIQAFLAINRVDLAESELENVTDHVLAKISRGYVSLYQDPEAIRRALSDFEDLNDTYKSSGISSLLGNAIAVCHFALGEWETGGGVVKVITDSFPTDQTAAINLGVARCHTSKTLDELKNQIDLIRSFQQNTYNLKIDEMLHEFDEVAARLNAK
jgi:hypothetical protein